MTLNSYNLVYQVGINQIRSHSLSLHAFANVSPCRLGNRDCVPTQRQTAGSLDAPGVFQLSRALFLHVLCPFCVSSLLPVTVSGKLFGKKSQQLCCHVTTSFSIMVLEPPGRTSVEIPRSSSTGNSDSGCLRPGVVIHHALLTSSVTEV